MKLTAARLQVIFKCRGSLFLYSLANSTTSVERMRLQWPMTNIIGDLMASEWYAVRTKSRHEEKVNIQLQKKLFNVFLPKMEVWSRRKDRRKRILTPLFPGYLFVRCELSRIIWLDILKTFGVAYVVGLMDEPTPIPENQIDNIKKVLDSKMSLKLHPYVNVGDKVIVADGPLQGAVGYYVAPNHEKGKLILSLDLLNRSVEIETDGSSIERY